MKVSYPDGEVTHPPGEYMVELPSAGPPCALLLHICDEITRKESFYSWAQWTYSLGNLHPACIFF